MSQKENDDFVRACEDEILCDEKYCYLNKDGKILYSDGAHFNIYGSTYFAKYLDQAIKTVLHK